MAAAVKDAAVADAPTKSGPSLNVQIGVLLVMTGAAVAMGWLSGGLLTGGKPGAEPAAHAAASGHGGSKSGHDAEAPAAETIIPLAAITTNIASPSDVWVRME